MRTKIFFFCVLLFSMFFVVEKDAFSQVIQINESFSKDTTLTPFSGFKHLYSLKMSGSVRFFSDSSLVRVVLADNYGNHYLLYEAYPLITTSDKFEISMVSDETCYLDDIKPDYLRIDIIDAFLGLDSLNLDTNYIANIKQLQAQAKWKNDSIKIRIMNQRIAEEKMYWRAGRTSVVERSFQEREQMFGQKHNLAGFDYYKGGIFECICSKDPIPVTTEIVNSFDWRNRHGANNPNSPYYDSDTHEGDLKSGWLTEVRNQGDCGSCYIFSVIAGLEARLNIYYNTHDKNTKRHYDIDLSEQHVLSCGSAWGSDFTCNGGFPYGVASWLVNNKVVEENCYPYKYSDEPCDLCENYQSVKKVGILGFTNFTFSLSDLKKWLITNGPLPCTYKTTNINHSMLLIGYDDVNMYDTVYKASFEGDKDIIIDEESPLNGTITFIFKNSSGYNNPMNEPFYVVSCNLNEVTNEIKLNGALSFENFSVDVQYSDEDDDGYYWWGIGPIPTNMPASFSKLEDCDDNNKNVGPYNLDSNSGLPLYQCTDNCGELLPTITLNDSEYSIDTNFHLNSSIIIPQNKTLIINSTVWINKDAYIIVQPGGKLTITPDGRLTTACNDLWQGIIVEGTSAAQSESVQGQVEFTSNIFNKSGSIENAICAITAENGAIIKATNANFINNRTSVYFTGYTNLVTLTQFTETTFQTAGTLIDGSQPEQFVKLEDLTNSTCIKFEGCVFTETDALRKTKGIYANNARFTCDQYVSLLSKATSFNNLLYGIYATTGSFSSGSPFTANECVFAGNFRGIYASAIVGAQITSNTMNVPLINSSFVPEDGYSSYGMYLDGCNTYHIENNAVDGALNDEDQVPEYVKSCGAYIKNSGANANEVYRNTFSGLHCGIATFGTNRNGTNEGLCIKCNTFSQNITDIGVYRGSLTLTTNIGIKYDQGVYNTTATSFSAGNIFSSSSLSIHEWDIDNTYSNAVRYNHHYLEPGLPKIQPDVNKCSSNITIHQNLLSYYTSSSCPDALDNLKSSPLISSLKEQMVMANAKADSIAGRLLLLTDGGNTEALAEEVTYSIPPEAWDTYASLLGKSPYLSDTVMKIATAKEEVLNNAMLRDILIANPQSAKNDSILVLAQNRFVPMPDSMMAEILEGKNIAGDKEMLEMQLAGWKQTYATVFNDLLNIYLAEGSSDSIAVLLAGDDRLASQYSLALLRLQKGEITAADAVMANISLQYNPPQGEYLQYIAYYNCLKRAVQNNAPLTFDSLQVTNLQNIIAADSNDYFAPTILARNALLTAGIIHYYEPVTMDAGVKSTPAGHVYGNKKPKETKAYLNIYPNPAGDFITIDYEIKKTCSNINCSVTTMDGKTVIKEKLNKEHDQKIIYVKTLQQGDYLITLYSGNSVLSSQKFTIKR